MQANTVNDVKQQKILQTKTWKPTGHQSYVTTRPNTQL